MSKYRKKGVFINVVIMLMGIICGFVMVFVRRFVIMSRILLNRVVDGVSFLWFGFRMMCIMWGLMRLIKFIIFEV